MKAVLLLIFFCVLSTATATQETIEQQLEAAEAAYASREFLKAIERFQPLLTHFEQTAERQQLADILFKMGRSNRRLGKFTEAQQLLKRAMELHTEIRDNKGLAFDLTEIAIAHQRQGNYNESLTVSQQALPLHEQVGSLVGIARTLENFGNIYYRQGEFDKAIEAFERALPAATDSGDKEALALVLMNSGQVYFAKGDLGRALEHFQQGAKLSEQMGDLTLLAPSIANAALVYWNQGDLKRAATDTKRALSIFHQVGNRPLEAAAYFDLGSLEHELGHYDTALQHMEHSLEMAQELGDKGLAATALHAIATVELEIGSYASALNHTQQSLKISQEIGEKGEVSAGFVKLGRISSRQGNDSAALKYYQEALQIDREMDHKRAIHFHLRELGDLYYKMDDMNKALSSYEQALSVQEFLGSKGEMGLTYVKLGAVYRRKQDLQQGDATINKGILLAREAGNPDYLWPALYQKGLISRDMGKLEDSLRWLKESVEILEGIRAGVGLPEQKSSYLEKRLDVYEDLIGLLVQSKNIADSFEYVQRSKARAFLDLLTETRIDPQASLDPATYDKKRKLIAELIRFNGKIKEEKEKEDPDFNAVRRLEKKRDETDQEYVSVLIEIRRNNPRFAELQNPQPLKLAEAQALLDSDSVLLDYFVGEKSSMVFAITTNTYYVFPLPEPKKLSEEIQTLLGTLQKPEPVWEATEQAYSRYIRTASILYQQILKPAELVWKNKSRIIVAADGPLHYLPFETLLTSQTRSTQIDFAKLPYFGLGHEIQYIPSISALAALARDKDRSASGQELIAFADPSSAKNPAIAAASEKIVREWSSSLPPLRYAREEVQKISQLFPRDQALILLGKDANEAALKTMRLDEFRTVHFASHGLVDEEHPQLSSLLLNAGSPEEDGYLTMREVFDLHLNADLVVLSACKSGLGKNIRGEGLTGLARAFFVAGASSVLVSLWNVNDQSTADFIAEFYGARKVKGMSKAAALKQARVKMIRASKYSHPYYWSTFILIGL